MKLDNVIPYVFRFLGDWQALQGELDRRAALHGLEPYSASPNKYRLSGWGLRFAGLSPVLAVYATYMQVGGGTTPLEARPGDGGLILLSGGSVLNP